MVWCVYSTLFSCFFLLPLFISQNRITIFSLFFTFLKPNLLASLSAAGWQQSVSGWQRASSPAVDGKLVATTDRLAKKETVVTIKVSMVLARSEPICSRWAILFAVACDPFWAVLLLCFLIYLFYCYILHFIFCWLFFVICLMPFIIYYGKLMRTDWNTQFVKLP